MVMAIALVLLVAVTAIAIFGAQGAMLNERIAGNERDRLVALKAAEAALSDAEASLLQIVGPTADCDTVFTLTCTNGLCSADGLVPATEVWREHKDKAIAYGRFTKAAEFRVNGRSPQRPPAFLIEWFPRDLELRGIRPTGGESRRSLFRIYAWGYGMNPQTEVLVESLLNPPDNLCYGL
jgi:type IV pilus assembly protein PilX